MGSGLDIRQISIVNKLMKRLALKIAVMDV